MDPNQPGLRAPWARSDRRIPRRLIVPIRRYIHTERAGGIALFAAAVVALAWANSPWSDAYESLWTTKATLTVGPLSFTEDLRHWVNDLLMAVFFFVVGLEIKRELVVGELRTPARAAFPAVAALGGMIVPAAIFLLLAPAGEARQGWGIPMATDIAFAIGVVALLSRRVPPALPVFLLALAIADDIGAILVIALVYTNELHLDALGIAGAILLVIAALRRLEVRHMAPYVLLAGGLWVATFESGIHATIAGVALGLMTPARPFQSEDAARMIARDTAERGAVRASGVPYESEEDVPDPDTTWLALAEASRESVSPLARLEGGLHPWSSFVILPIFALANAGVNLGEASFGALAIAVAAGLVIGKPLGIVGISLLANRLTRVEPPSGVGWRHVAGAGGVAGIGFTVALFVADLAFESPALKAQARLGILAGSLVAAVVGAAVLRAGRTESPSAESEGVVG